MKWILETLLKQKKHLPKESTVATIATVSTGSLFLYLAWENSRLHKENHRIHKAIPEDIVKRCSSPGRSYYEEVSSTTLGEPSIADSSVMSLNKPK